MTREKMETMVGRGFQVYFRDSYGKRWRTNGRMKTWKTRPEEFRVPIKHGLYLHGYITHENIELFELDEKQY